VLVTIREVEQKGLKTRKSLRFPRSAGRHKKKKRKPNQKLHAKEIAAVLETNILGSVGEMFKKSKED